MKIEFDPNKRHLTLENRGLDMARAGEVLSGKTITVADERFEYGEARFISFGHLDGRLVALAWTRRGSAYRIISMRKANEREQKTYQPKLG